MPVVVKIELVFRLYRRSSPQVVHGEARIRGLSSAGEMAMGVEEYILD